MTRCLGLSWNGWLYFTPGHVLQSLVDRRFLRSCSNHKTKLVMTAQGRDWIERQVWKEQADGEA